MMTAEEARNVKNSIIAGTLNQIEEKVLGAALKAKDNIEVFLPEEQRVAVGMRLAELGYSVIDGGVNEHSVARIAISW